MFFPQLLLFPFLLLFLLLPINPLPNPLLRIPRRPLMRIHPRRNLNRIPGYNPLFRNLMPETQPPLRMLNISFRLRHTNNLRPHAQTREIRIVLTVRPDLEIDGGVCLAEMFFELVCAPVADGVGGCADGFAHLEYDARAGGAVAFGGAAAEGPFVFGVGGGDVGEGVDAAVAVVGGAAMADPHEVPAIAVGGDFFGEVAGVVGGIEGPVGYGFDAVADADHGVFEAHVPVDVAFHYQGCADVFVDDSGLYIRLDGFKQSGNNENSLPPCSQMGHEAA